MKNPQILRRMVSSIALAALTSTAFAQTIWDGNTDPNLSGGWNVPENWSTNLVPSAVAVQLNNVTTGTRTVTYNTAEESISGLTFSQSTVGATNRLVIDGQTLTNTGSTTLTQTGGAIVWDILNGGAYRLNSSTGTRTINSGSTLNLGSGADGTSGVLTGGPNTGTGSGTLTFNNTGTATLYNSSQMGWLSTTGTTTASTFTFNNNSGGTLNLAGATTGNGIRMGVLDHNANPTIPVFTNASGATVNVTRVASESSGTGVSSWGNFDPGSQRSGATVNNAGEFNIAENAQFTVQGRRNATDTNTTRFNNNAGGVLTLGDSASDTATGTLALQISTQTGSGNTNAGLFFTNDGTTTLYGTSAIRVGTAGSNDGGSLTVANNATGVINLHNTSSIGTTNRSTIFSNNGTLTKHGAGTASVLSNASGSATNNGILNVQTGTLAFSSALTNSGTIGGGGTLQTAGITSTGGNFAAGNSIGTLTLALTNTTDEITFEAPTTFTFELGTPNGTAGVNNDLIAFTGLSNTLDNVFFNGNTVNFSDFGGLGAGLYTLFTFDQANAYTGTLAIGSGLDDYAGSSFVYNADNIQLNVIPEPQTALVLLLAFGAIFAYHRRATP